MAASGLVNPGTTWELMSTEAITATELAVRSYRVAGEEFGAVSEHVAIELHNLENELRAILQKR